MALAMHPRNKALITLSLALSFLLVANLLITLVNTNRNITMVKNSGLENARQRFQEEIDRDAEVIKGLLCFITKDQALTEAWLRKDRDALLRASLPIFEEIRQDHRVTHFYFHQPDRINFLRVHNPELHGDLIARYTMEQAAKSGGKSQSINELECNPQASYGIELGPFGVFALRVVAPWYIEGELVGYIELGEEIDHVLRRLSGMLKSNLFFIIEKKYLDEEKWYQGAKNILQLTDDSAKKTWGQFDDFVITGQVHDEVISDIARLHLSLEDHDHDKVSRLIVSPGFDIGFLPLIDAERRVVGHVMVPQKTTEYVNILKQMMIWQVAVSFIIWLVVLLYFGRLSGRLVTKLNNEIHERKEAEERLSIINEKLHQAKEKAEEATRAKSDFLANMTHEFRTPMHAILSFSNFGISKIDKAEKEQLLKYFEKIRMSGERLLPLLNNILDLSKLEAGKMTFAVVESDLHVLVQNVISEFGGLAAEKKVFIELADSVKDVDEVVQCDPEKTGQVVRNLLSNAVKFTSSGKRIVVSLAESTLPGGRRVTDKELTPAVVVQVANEGTSIPDGDLANIFEQFAQSSASTDTHGGTGLGLSICRRIVEGQGGRIWAEHNPAGGAIFSFSLPRFALSSQVDDEGQQ